MRLAILSFRYPVAISPTIKGIARYFSDSGNRVTLIVDTGSEFLTNELPEIAIVDVTPNPPTEPGLVRRLLARGQRTIRRYLRDRTKPARNRCREQLSAVRLAKERLKPGAFDAVYCVEAHSLWVLAQSPFPLSKTVYVSLELGQIVKSEYSISRTRSLLKQCAGLIIQSSERAALFNREIGDSLDFSVLPVSVTPREPTWTSVDTNTDAVRIVYSGYIADWAMVTEFLAAAASWIHRSRVTLTIHGHSTGTTSYRNEVAHVAAETPQVDLFEEQFSDVEHQRFLDRFDIGLAFYMEQDGNPNWQGLLRSSGKIATYLWSGLAVMTNIKHKDTELPPFIYVDDFGSDSIRRSIEHFSVNRELFRQAALEYARDHYNLFAHMDRIVAELSVHEAVAK